MTNDIKLMITTALDAAGIKATDDQIKRLSNTINKSNKENVKGFNNLRGEIIKLGVKFGLVSKDMIGGLGKFAGALGAVLLTLEAFTKGLKIGQQIFHQFGDGATYTLESIGNGFVDLTNKAKNFVRNFYQKTFIGVTDEDAIKAAHEVAMKNQETMIENAKKASEKITKYISDVKKEEESLVKSIDDVTKGFLRQANTAAKLKDAQGDAQIIALETNKFREQYEYRKRGQDKVAEQIGKMWDVEIEKVKASNKFQAAQVEQSKIERQIASSLEKLEISNEALVGYENKINEAQKTVNELSMMKGTGANIIKLKHARTALEQAKEVYYDKREQNLNLRSTIEDLYYKMQLNKQMQANIKSTGTLNIDEAVLDYESWVSKNGNVGKFEINRQYFQALDRQAGINDTMLEKQTKNTQLLIEKLDELLSIKGE